MLSMNRWQRSKLIAEAKHQYRQMLLEAGVGKLSRFSVQVSYWSKIDADNICLKYFIDTLRAEGMVINDDKRYFDGVSSTPDATLKHNTYLVKIKGTQALESSQEEKKIVKNKVSKKVSKIK